MARARIRRLDPIADAASNTLGYWADVIGGAGLVPGVAVNAHVPRAAPTSTFWIPRSTFPAAADLRRGAGAALFVLEGDRVAARTVRINAVEGVQVEIGSGLGAGDRVILAPAAELKAGDVVTVKL